MKLLHGVITSMTTPFCGQSEIDLTSLKKQVDFQIEKGIDCLYVLGSTGESYLLNDDECKLVAETVIRQVDRRVPVYVQVARHTVKDTIAMANFAKSAGADGVGVAKRYGKDIGIFIPIYREISAGISDDFPIYIDEDPIFSNIDAPNVIGVISDLCKNVVGVKYNSNDMSNIIDLCEIKKFGGHFSVLLGSEKLFLAGLACGVDGLVSECSGAVPEPFLAVHQAYQSGENEKARALQYLAKQISRELTFGCEMSDLRIFKEILRHRGIVNNCLMHWSNGRLTFTDNEMERIWRKINQYLKSYSLLWEGWR